MMDLKVCKAELEEILTLRELFLQENNFQIRYNACHERNWSDTYLLIKDGVKIGYGSIKGKENLKDRDTVFEFYVIPVYRKIASPIFSGLLTASRATFIECQSNDFLLSAMLYEFTQNIYSDVVLFKDEKMTEFEMPDVVFRKKEENDVVFTHKVEPVGGYVLEWHGEVVATGGFMLHYNLPFVDLYMEVREECRRKRWGSFLLQELKKECYRQGRVPAARCGMENLASRAALLKAGLTVAGFMLTGKVKNRTKDEWAKGQDRKPNY